MVSVYRIGGRLQSDQRSTLLGLVEEAFEPLRQQCGKEISELLQRATTSDNGEYMWSNLHDADRYNLIATSMTSQQKPTPSVEFALRWKRGDTFPTSSRYWKLVHSKIVKKLYTLFTNKTLSSYIYKLLSNFFPLWKIVKDDKKRYYVQRNYGGPFWVPKTDHFKTTCKQMIHVYDYNKRNKKQKNPKQRHAENLLSEFLNGWRSDFVQVVTHPTKRQRIVPREPTGCCMTESFSLWYDSAEIIAISDNKFVKSRNTLYMQIRNIYYKVTPLFFNARSNGKMDIKNTKYCNYLVNSGTTTWNDAAFAKVFRQAQLPFVKKTNLASLPKTKHFVKLNDMNFSNISVDSVELNDKRIYATYYRKKHEIISYLHHHAWLRLPEWERLEKLQRERILKHLANAKEEIISVWEHSKEKIKEIEANVNSPDRVSCIRRLKDDGIARWDHYFKWNTYWWTVYQQLYT